ncbi:trafficking kinesin-binding protein 1-like isoform X2 [Syngnathoides biaculeatus]|uniref:trafficking kinesin-binding protein 1-like isoform X2 n=1 Tax=Syngnathoides biaculeatus TaxID=300417 RepID=UPI002ADD3EC0|nr:trafficking kinesin-binding protein 1-like isoform X2 [Syngnathoides biaculeatus]
MALLPFTGSDDGPDWRQESDAEFVYLPRQESTGQEKEMLHVCLASLKEQEEVEVDEMDEEQPVISEVLCADRVGQMTKTYSDIDAVTRLLEEKERDLELAARIGQSLLKKNKALSERNELLEEQVEHIREEVSQLRHDVSMKDELLQFYTNAAEESEGESTTSTPVRPSENNVPTPTYFPLDSLQKKLKDLEEENKSLRSEASHLETETLCYEEKEQQLVNDCVKELRVANLQISSLAEELARKSEDASRQQEEITHLLSQIVDLQKKAKMYAVENEELTQHLGAAKDAQRQLTAELGELQDKYAECIEMLHEAQEELKNLRNKAAPSNTQRRFHSLGLFAMDSLAAEIEGTMRKELQMDDPDVEELRLQPKRVFQTVKNLNLMRQQRSSLAPSPLNIPGSNQSSCIASGRSSRVGTPRSNSMYGSETGSGIMMDNRSSCILETPDNGSEDSNKWPPGAPGTPGSQDLERALRRLSLRRDNYLSEKRFFEEERERKLAYLAKEEEKGGSECSGGLGTPSESLFSLCSHPSLGSAWSGYSFTARSYLPEKLQIVKPLEGSATLYAWQQLAQPHMGALLDDRPGVVTKGFRTLSHEHDEMDAWQLDQPEEDEVLSESCAGLSGESFLDTLYCSSPLSVCRSKTIKTDASNPSETLHGEREATLEKIQAKDVIPSASPPTSSPTLSSSEMNGHVDLKELCTPDHLPVNFPGKCMSHTSSTYTLTTCRILHPSDQQTSMSTSSALSSCQSSTSSTPVVFSAPHTPSYTPCCTPRRLSLSQSLAESSTNLRDPTKTTSTSLGLGRLLLEHGISASVYDPSSWDRGSVRGEQLTSSDTVEWNDGRLMMKRPNTLFLLQPSTPPNSPRSCTKSAAACPDFQFSPSDDDPLCFDSFLASKPARIILREVLGEAERERSGQTDKESQTEMINLKLVEKLKSFHTLPPHTASIAPASSLIAPFCPTGFGNTALGLNTGLRRNRSYPAMVGASMAMKDPGGPHTTDIIIPHLVQVPPTQPVVHVHETQQTQTNHTLTKTQDTVSSLTTKQTQATSKKMLQDLCSKGES